MGKKKEKERKWRQKTGFVNKSQGWIDRWLEER